MSIPSPQDLERLALDQLWKAIKANESVTVLGIERRLGKGRGWLTRRLKGKEAGMRLSAFFAVLQILDIQPVEFFDHLPDGQRAESKQPLNRLVEKAKAKIEGKQNG